MSILDANWGTIHSSALSHSSALLRWARATPRPHGALRYQCPVTGSLLLVTDEETLKGLSQPHSRIRCPDCGEMHLLVQDRTADEPCGAFVAAPARP